MKRLLAAVDVGGTFIDVVLTDTVSHRTEIAKVLHRKGDQGADILAALAELSARVGASIADIDTVVVGTTVVTNALLEGALAKTALITTDGFRDVLEIGRMTRPSSYDLHRRRAPVVVPRDLRLEVCERLDHNGETLISLDTAPLIPKIALLSQAGVEVVAISLLYSFVNAENEKIVKSLVQAAGLATSVSSEVLSVFREFERTTATVLNAATMPVMARFLNGLQYLKDNGIARAYIMGSAGGCLTFAEAERFPIKCAMSGPAGGIVASLELAKQHGLNAVLTLDVGGTSSDIAMLRDGKIPVTDDRVIGGYPVAVSSAEIETIGAGGGSLAYVDRAGSLRVGPASAGSTPGPVSYGRGGTQPAVTDAHLALNRLGENSMLNGTFKLDRPAAIAAIEEHIARPLGVTWQRAAYGVLQITTANIVRAIRTMSTERGHDPRHMTLVAFGGAGPLHAIEVARALEIPKVLIPYFSGVFSAQGILSVNIAYDAQQTWLRGLSDVVEADFADLAGTMVKSILLRVTADGIAADHLKTNWSVDLRFRGQSHAITVPLAAATLSELMTSRILFIEEHRKRYGHASDTAAVELVNIRLNVSQPRGEAAAAVLQAQGTGLPFDKREIWVDDATSVDCPIYRRSDLPVGWSATGPLVIEQFDSVTVLGPGDKAEVLAGSLALSVTIRA